MDAEKIVENMKAVLKKTKRKKSLKMKKIDSNINTTEQIVDDEEDKVISELMTKNWQMKTPPVNKKDELNECDDDSTNKVNAFEKMMSRRSNNADSTSQNPLESPDAQNKTSKRKYIKKSLNTSNLVLNGPSKNELNMTVDSQESLLTKTDSTKKRLRANEEPVENSSKKRRIKASEVQLDSNENSLDQSDIKQIMERPKRSCTGKVDYSLFTSPEKGSPEKKAARGKSEALVIPKVATPVKKELKENVKLAPLFTKRTKKPLAESTLPEENLKIKEVLEDLNEKPYEICPEKNGHCRPRRSCAAKTDYSVFDTSLENNSPEKKNLRKKLEPVKVTLEPEEKLDLTPVNQNGEIASVFSAKSKTKPTRNDSQLSPKKLEKTPVKPTTPETPQSGRPKRSCTGKIDYSQLFNSPEKKSPEKKMKAAKNTDVIYVDETSPIKKKANVKLAPLFMKKVPKPVIDPAVLEARRNFLLSELPANLRAPIEKQRQYEEDILSNDMIAFPQISHITQLALSDEKFDHHEGIYSHSKIRVNQFENDDISLNEIPTLKYGMLTNCKDTDSAVINNRLEPISDIKEAVRIIKDNCGNFPVNRCFKQILNKLKCAKENDEANENVVSHQNSSFVEIFKPSCFEEILIGSEPVKQLQDFLNTWNERRYDNYESDDSSSRQSMKAMNNCVVLSGKNGSGKTSSVFALANDLNYEVIEINAGSKRNGKKILQDLLEATQSHRVEKNLMDDDQSCDNNINDSADKKTIILIEDAELTFENDDGFVSSIQQLINISKRPVILTTNDSSCQHLQKFLQYNEIIYDSPKNYLTKYLSLICIATANYRVDEDEIDQLYTLNRHDLRKTINEIEFFIRSECASVNSGSLMGLFCGTKNKNRPTKSSSQMALRSQRALSPLHSQSSIISDYSAMLSCSRLTLKGGEISYHQYNLMNEMAKFVGESNLPKTEYQNDSAQKDRQQIISR